MALSGYEIETKKCGKFWHSYRDEGSMRELAIKKACNMIIHATDIVIKPSKYYYRDEGKESDLKRQDKSYFQDKINITGKGKRNQYAELDLAEFTQHCIELSNKISEGMSDDNIPRHLQIPHQTGNKILHTGITNDLRRREYEH